MTFAWGCNHNNSWLLKCFLSLGLSSFCPIWLLVFDSIHDFGVPECLDVDIVWFGRWKVYMFGLNKLMHSQWHLICISIHVVCVVGLLCILEDIYMCYFNNYMSIQLVKTHKVTKCTVKTDKLSGRSTEPQMIANQNHCLDIFCFFLCDFRCTSHLQWKPKEVVWLNQLCLWAWCAWLSLRVLTGWQSIVITGLMSSLALSSVWPSPPF